MGDFSYVLGMLFGLIIFFILHRPIIRMCEWIVGIKPLKDPFKKEYTEVEVKRIANEAYIQGAVDFNNRERGKSFECYWNKQKIIKR